MTETTHERAERLAAEALPVDDEMGATVRAVRLTVRTGYVRGYLAREAESRTPTVDEVAAVLDRHARCTWNGRDGDRSAWTCGLPTSTFAEHQARAVLALLTKEETDD